MLIAYEVAKSLIPTLAPIAAKIERSARSLALQLRSAASSVSLNLGEGARSLKGNKHYAIAHGSASEVRAALETAIGWGYIDQPREALAVLDRLLGLLWGLTHPK
jgi:four helix bundle protein